MSNPTRTPAPLPARSVRFVPDPDGQGDQIVITARGATSVYWLDVLTPDYGDAAYRLEKSGGAGDDDNTQYDVLLDGNASTCSCPDFTFRGWKKGPCKHILACQKIHGAGTLAGRKGGAA